MLPPGPAEPVILTAVATDSVDNSSEFSINAYSPDYTSVAEFPIDLPTTFALEQNYPNPFNASTVISFNLSHSARARLAVYNLLGQEVQVVVGGAAQQRIEHVLQQAPVHGVPVVQPDVVQRPGQIADLRRVADARHRHRAVVLATCVGGAAQPGR